MPGVDYKHLMGNYLNFVPQQQQTPSQPQMILGNYSGEAKKRETDNSEEQPKKRRRKSRWGGDETDKTTIPGMPLVIPTNLTKEQEEAYVLQLQIEEVNRKLRSGDLGIPANPEQRSPSPEPIYSHDGKRMNTREYRTRKRLEEQRHQLITRMVKVNPDFKPPPDYKPPMNKVNDKVMIPQDVYPDINFVGLLIGPRGNTLKSMELETGAKIIIRGKGSVKEGKVGRKDGQPLPGENEPLHAYVTGLNPECVKKAVEKIKEVIKQGVEVPEGQNDLRRQQLRELALLNGTLRENDGVKCTNCGASDHKSWQCQDRPNVTASVVCTICGGGGHVARDCLGKRPGAAINYMPQNDRAKIDEEYMSLMAELGEGPPPPSRSGNADSNRSNASSGGLFDKREPPRALMDAPAFPPHMIPDHLPHPMQFRPLPPPVAPPSSTGDDRRLSHQQYSNNAADGNRNRRTSPPMDRPYGNVPVDRPYGKPLIDRPYGNPPQSIGSRSNQSNSSGGRGNSPQSAGGHLNSPQPMGGHMNAPPNHGGGMVPPRMGWGPMPPYMWPPYQHPHMMGGPPMGGMMGVPPPPPPPPAE